MRVWLFVEGPSDRLGLDALWDGCGWANRLRLAGHGLPVIPLDNKTTFLKKIGPRAAEKLAANDEDLVVGLPDLYPLVRDGSSPYCHNNLLELVALQRRLVKTSLTQNFRVHDADTKIDRFFPSAFKHDFEMLLLAAETALEEHTAPENGLGNWKRPLVEEQNHEMPPKLVISEIFLHRSKSRRAYRDTKDAPNILRRVTDISQILFANQKQPKCPVFRRVVDWIGQKTGVPAY